MLSMNEAERPTAEQALQHAFFEIDKPPDIRMGGCFIGRCSDEDGSTLIVFSES